MSDYPKVHEHWDIYPCNSVNGRLGDLLSQRPHSIGLCPQCHRVAHDAVTCKQCASRIAHRKVTP